MIDHTKLRKGSKIKDACELFTGIDVASVPELTVVKVISGEDYWSVEADMTIAHIELGKVFIENVDGEHRVKLDGK